MSHLRYRFWGEAVLGTSSGLAFLALLAWPTWIESLFEVAPDGGTGEAEAFVAVGLLLLAITCSFLMRVEIRRGSQLAAAEK